MGSALRRAFGGIAAAAAVAIAVPFLVPLSHVIPKLEHAVSARLGQPVSIEELKLHLLPTPRVVAYRITVGRKAQVLIGELDIEPDLASLVFGPRAIRLVRASRVAIDESALLIPRGMPKRLAEEPVLVRRLVLTTVKLRHSKIDLPLFDVDMVLGEDLQVHEARLETQDGALKLMVETSEAGSATVLLSATNWTLPVGAPLVFDALAVQGTLRGQQLELGRIEGELYGGRLVGAAHADWTKQWQLAGKAHLAGVDLVPMQKALGKPAKLSGRLKADAAFSSSAKTPAELRGRLALDGPFEVLGGVYQGVDLSRAGELAGERRSGGTTTFEELKGDLELRGEHVKLTRLCMRSPKIVAGGNVEIAADKSLSGKLDISMAQTGGFVGVPVALGGTTDDPSVRPSKGYLIGAAIGTVLMPVIGTSIGSSLGGQIERTSDCK
jgi:hypothetical protein